MLWGGIVPLPLANELLRKLTPSLEHVTCREPTVTLSRLAISSRLTPCASQSLILEMFSEVNLLGCLRLTKGQHSPAAPPESTECQSNRLINSCFLD